MRKFQICLALIAGSWAAGLGAAPPPAEAYGRLPAIGSVALSPDGKRVIVGLGFEYNLAKPDSDLTAVRLVNLDTGKVEHTLAPPPGNTVRSVGWADDQRPFYSLSESANLAD